MIPFGKYKGKSIEWVYNNDKKYFTWLTNLSLKEPFYTEVKNFFDKLQEEENKIVYNILNKIDKYLQNGETIYQINIHNVGVEYLLKDISLQEVIGNQYDLYINLWSDKLQHYKLCKENFKVLQEVLYKKWLETGKHTKTRGLY